MLQVYPRVGPLPCATCVGADLILIVNANHRSSAHTHQAKSRVLEVKLGAPAAPTYSRAALHPLRARPATASAGRMLLPLL